MYNIIFDELIISLENIKTIIDSSLFFKLLESVIVITENLFEFLKLRITSENKKEINYNINLQLIKIEKLKSLKL